MINAQQLGEKITRMFNFMYEVNGEWYVLGRDYFRVCSDFEYGVYTQFCSALDNGDRKEIIFCYRRVRRYVSDCQPNDRERDMKIIQFVNELDADSLKSLSEQVSRAEEYANIAYL